MPSRTRWQIVVTLAVVFCLGASAAFAQSGWDGLSAFKALKTLAGEWQGQAFGPGTAPATLRYQVSSNGTVVVETFAPGTSAEMNTVYYMDGSDLVLTHYCAGGNQPWMKMNQARSQPGVVVFDFMGAMNLDPTVDLYMRSGNLYLIDAGRLDTEWTTYQNGQLLDTQRVVYTRVR